MLPDGSQAYTTRDGSFQIDQNGQLVTASGFPVQPAITIPANALSITVGHDVIVSVTQQGQKSLLSKWVNSRSLVSSTTAAWKAWVKICIGNRKLRCAE